MKKYLFGAAALVLAIAFSAFTTKTTEVVFEFIGTTQAQLESPDYWVLEGQSGGAAISCNSVDAGETCKITFNDAVYDQASELTRNSGSGITPYKLRSDFQIDASGDVVVLVEDAMDNEVASEPTLDTNLIQEP